ncbi:type VI secretion system Vgr family protein [Paraburkholderia sp. ZP32-5]|uniref:type VI secretion system Vgr family protein n=1 Tax=Paraburkholderia sp. ZP32-5 TaxID=2883245 RepID=UPI001F3CE214|nr:type VI secretion system Vgr family protein [Paraburkholderia sp. ZP32-5]
MNTALADAAARAGIDVHQYYSLEMRQTPSAALADIFSFTGSRGICEPTRYTIQFTHPQHDLSRTDYVNQSAAFVTQPPPATQWSPPEEPRRVPGVITAFAHLSDSRDQAVYEVVLESRLALLRNSPRCRFFLDMTEVEIITQILKEHDFNQVLADFRFDLYRSYCKHPFVMQWAEDDLTFITRLCRRTGIWFVCEQGKNCEFVRFGDDYKYYLRDADRLTVPYQQPGGLLTTALESVRSLEMRAATIAANYAVRSYSPEQPAAEAVDADKPISNDRTAYGEAYVWGSPYLSEAEAKEQALLRQEAALAGQVIYSGSCDMLDLTPGCVLKLSNRELADAKYGLMVVRVACSASRRQGYKVDFTAIPSDRQYRHPLEEHTWPRVHGVITGTVASTEGFKGPYLDAQGRYVVDLHPDRDQRTPGLNSCPMRLAKPFAGPGQTGFHFGLEPGVVVTVAFLWGNPDLPYISAVLHTAQQTDPIVSGNPWATRHTIRTRSNNTLQMEDLEGREHIKIATESGKTQLNLGSLVNSRQQSRGQGFEVRTDERGALRAGNGLFLSADAQDKAGGQAFDMKAAQQQLQAAQSRMKSLSEAVAQARATLAACEAQQTLLDTQISDLQAAVLLASAPHGMAFTTGEHMQLAAGGHLFTTTGGNADAAVGGNYTVAAGNAVSLFANTQGMKLYAAAGLVDVQSQGDGLNLAALKAITIASTGDSITLNASQSLTLVCGGSYLKLSSAGVEIGSPHNVTLKGPLQVGPSGTLQQALPMMPRQEAAGMQLFHTYTNGQPVKNAPYKVTFADGSWRAGTLDGAGKATLANVPRGGGTVAYDEAAGDVARAVNRFKDAAGGAVSMRSAGVSGDSSASSASGASVPSMSDDAIAAPVAQSFE